MNKKGYYLFLDDIRIVEDVRKYITLPNIPDKRWIIVRNYDEFVECIKNRGIPKFVAFDHDLAFDQYDNYHGIDEKGRLIINYDKFKEKTGYDCAKFLVEECIKRKIKFPEYVVHSMNPVGKCNIESYIESYLRSCR